MRNIKLIVEYDGSDFQGWQLQLRGRTVQGVLNQAVDALLGERPNLLAAGRTDAGVHAAGQVVNFQTARRLSPDTICRGLNAHLPKDVRVLAADEVPMSFHARYDAVSREYRYTIARQRLAIGRQYAWFCSYQIDLERIREASTFLLGSHDFRAFAKKNETEKHYLSQIDRISWGEEANRLYLDICANRFLHNMVRIIVGTMLEVGRGKLTPANMPEILQRGERSLAGFTVPAHGLCLMKVNYETN